MERSHGKSIAAGGLRKKALEICLERLKPHPNPKVFLEQYSIPGKLAAEMLHLASFVYDDIRAKLVADLGSGTGRLAIGAAILGAWRVIGIDIDSEAIGTAKQNARRLGVEVEWLVGDIQALRGHIETIVMNPPFGARRRHMDMIFLEKALSLARVVYSLHKQSTRDYIMKVIEKIGAQARILPTTIEIPHMFDFHRKARRCIRVDMYRIEGRE